MILETSRLIVRKASLEDFPFFLKLLNQTSYITNIRDSLVRDEEGARNFIQKFYLNSYEIHGFGLYVLRNKSSGETVGVCGPLKRDDLPFPDLGFALLEEHFKKGFIEESGKAILDYCREKLLFQEVGAITTLENEASQKVLKKLGFNYLNDIQLKHSDKSFRLFMLNLRTQSPSASN